MKGKLVAHLVIFQNGLAKPILFCHLVLHVIAQVQGSVQKALQA